MSIIKLYAALIVGFTAVNYAFAKLWLVPFMERRRPRHTRTGG